MSGDARANRRRLGGWALRWVIWRGQDIAARRRPDRRRVLTYRGQQHGPCERCSLTRRQQCCQSCHVSTKFVDGSGSRAAVQGLG